MICNNKIGKNRFQDYFGYLVATGQAGKVKGDRSGVWFWSGISAFVGFMGGCLVTLWLMGF